MAGPGAIYEWGTRNWAYAAEIKETKYTGRLGIRDMSRAGVGGIIGEILDGETYASRAAMTGSGCASSSLV